MKTIHLKRILFLVGTGVFFLGDPHFADACPLYKDLIKGVSRLTEGYSWTILLMIGIPFALIGLFSGLVIRSYQRAHPK